MSAVAAPPGRHRRSGPVLPEPPNDAEKASYAWRSLPYLGAALFTSTLCVIVAQLLFEARNLDVFPVAALIFGGYTLIYLAYQLLSLPVNYTGPSFDLAAHDALVRSWRPARLPSVDVLLPVCGEPIEVLRNTWIGVFELITAYPGKARGYVLDDGPDPELESMAADFGFSYLRRPDLRWRKKAGNLNYAFARTGGQHVVVFDAGFRPRPDFLAESLPYLDDPAVGIVQTPQFFRADPQQSWVERAAGPALEVFYRAVQVSRNRFSSALCVGSNAVYRRAALAPTGGFTLIPYAEDSHTGLDARYNGYRLTYVPVPLAAGICPATLDAFMRQQYRWCCGATSLVWSPHMWRVPMPLAGRLPYVAGWLWNLTTALRTLILPLIPITLLALAPGEIRLRNALLLIPAVLTGTVLYPLWHNSRYSPRNALLLIPAVLTGTVLYPLWHNSRYSPRSWPLSLAIGWAQVLGLWDCARGRVMSWQPTRGPGDATRRFWWGVTAWNGGLAIAWIALALWRIEQTGSSRFTIVAAFGVVNLVIVGRLIFPGRTSA